MDKVKRILKVRVGQSEHKRKTIAKRITLEEAMRKYDKKFNTLFGKGLHLNYFADPLLYSALVLFHLIL